MVSVVYRDEDGFRITKARWLELQAMKKGGYKVKRKEREKVEKKVQYNKNVSMVDTHQRIMLLVLNMKFYINVFDIIFDFPVDFSLLRGVKEYVKKKRKNREKKMNVG